VSLPTVSRRYVRVSSSRRAQWWELRQTACRVPCLVTFRRVSSRSVNACRALSTLVKSHQEGEWFRF
jgi:hypothetical protein